MPSPRSVLIDIHDFGLDPNKSHQKVDAGGRIKKPATASVVDEIKEQPVKDVEKLDTTSKEESSESSKREKADDVEQPQEEQSQSAVEQASSRKRKK